MNLTLCRNHQIDLLLFWKLGLATTLRGTSSTNHREKNSVLHTESTTKFTSYSDSSIPPAI